MWKIGALLRSIMYLVYPRMTLARWGRLGCGKASTQTDFLFPVPTQWAPHMALHRQ